jgi:hypothetical protein
MLIVETGTTLVITHVHGTFAGIMVRLKSFSMVL